MEQGWLDELWPGDILLTRRQEPLSQLIRFVDDLDLPGQPGTGFPRHVDASHAAVYLGRNESNEHVAGSVWPMPHGDVVVVPLLEMLGLYSGTVVLRQRHVASIGREEWEAGGFLTLRAEFDRLCDASACDPRLVFDDMRMVAAGLAASWDDIREFASLSWPEERVLDRLFGWVVRIANERDGLVCPDLFVLLFQALGERFQLIATTIPDPREEEFSIEALPPEVERSVILLVSLLTTQWLIDRWSSGPGESCVTVDFDRLGRYVTPGRLARSELLLPIMAVDAYAGVVARGEEVWTLKRARLAVIDELRWAPGVEPATLPSVNTV